MSSDDDQYPSATIRRHRYRSGGSNHLNLFCRLHFEHLRNPLDRATTSPQSAIGVSTAVASRPEVVEIDGRSGGGSVGHE